MARSILDQTLLGHLIQADKTVQWGKLSIYKCRLRPASLDFLALALLRLTQLFPH